MAGSCCGTWFPGSNIKTIFVYCRTHGKALNKGTGIKKLPLLPEQSFPFKGTNLLLIFFLI